jgi:hypothetical protein
VRNEFIERDFRVLLAVSMGYPDIFRDISWNVVWRRKPPVAVRDILRNAAEAPRRCPDGRAVNYEKSSITWSM